MGSLEGVSSISVTLSQEDIPSEFKLEWLNKTLKFIKNDKESIFKYPEMPSNQIKFLKTMIAGASCDIGYGFKNLYAPLWEALRILSLQYKFSMSIQRTQSNYGHLFLEKIPRSKDVTEIGSSELDSSCSSGRTTEVKQTKNQVTDNKKYIETVKKIIESISRLFIKNILNAIFEFLNDEAQASCAFDSLSRVEAQFVQQFLGILKRRTILEELFSPFCNRLWVKIADILDNATLYKIEVSGVTVDKETAMRSLTLKKVPIFSDKAPSKLRTPRKRCKRVIKDGVDQNLEPNVVNETETRDVASVLLESIEKCQNRINIKTKKDEQIQEKSMGLIQDQCLQMNQVDEKNSITDQIQDVPLQIPTDNEVPSTNSGSSTELVVDKTVGKAKQLRKPLPTMSSTPPSIDIKVINSAGLCKRKVKLIEALSTPIESDIGLRMMRSMGWEGGALGAREGGITEPIMPALHLVPKAGLGHEKDEKKKREVIKSRSEIRIRILEALLELFKKNLVLSYVDFDNCLNKNEINFLNNVKIALNKRKLLGVNVKAEIDLVQSILIFLIKNPSVNFDIEVLSRMRIKLEKIPVTPKQNPAENLKQLIGSYHSAPTSKSLIQMRLQVNQPSNPNITSSSPTNQPSQANQSSSSQTEQPSSSQANQLLTSQENQQTKGLINKIINEDMNNNEDDDSFLTNNQILSLLDLKEQLKISKKMLRKLKTRLFIMKSCLDFLKSGKDSVVLNYSLTPPIANFLYKLCSFVNNRKAERFAYSIENFVWLEIIQCVGDSYVIAKIESGRCFGFSKISAPNNRTAICVADKEIRDTGVENSESNKNSQNQSIEISNSALKNNTIVEHGNTSNVGSDSQSTYNYSDTVLENNSNREVKIVSSCNTSNSTESSNNNNIENCTDGTVVKNDKNNVQNSKNIFHFGSIHANTDVFYKTKNISDEGKDSFKFNFSEADVNVTSVASDENENVPFANVRIIEQIGKIMSAKTAAKVQNRISIAISPNFLPKLRCHGVKSDSLIYSCYNEKSFDFLKEVLSDFQIVKYEISGSYKMAATVRCFEGSLQNIFAMLKTYHGLNFERWHVLQETHYDDNIEFSVSLDAESFDYVCRNNFRLFAGIGEVSFDIIV